MSDITRRGFIGAGATAVMAAALAGCSTGSGSATGASASAASASAASSAAAETMTLVILRHGESEWNKENLFTGWTDVDLSDTGREEAVESGRALAAGMAASGSPKLDWKDVCG